MCKQSAVSGFALFLDMQAAYYQLLRQHPRGLDCSDEGILTLLHRMGVRDATIQDVAEAITEPCSSEQNGIHIPFPNLVFYHEWRLAHCRHGVALGQVMASPM